MSDATNKLREALARADAGSGLLEPIAADDLRATLERLDALLDASATTCIPCGAMSPLMKRQNETAAEVRRSTAARVRGMR